jgi:hypothetical protein
MKNLFLIITSLTISALTIKNLNATEIEFQSVFAKGSGCPEGTTQIIKSPDNQAVSILFDNFFIELPQYDGENENDSLSPMFLRRLNKNDPRISHKLCQIEIESKIPQGYMVESVSISIDFRGSTNLEAGSIASFRSFFKKWAGPRNQRKSLSPVAKKLWNQSPLFEDWTISEHKTFPTRSSCMVTQNGTVSFSLQNIILGRIKDNVAIDDSFALVAMDSADFTGSMELKVHIKPCGRRGVRPTPRPRQPRPRVGGRSGRTPSRGRTPRGTTRCRDPRNGGCYVR